MSEKYGNHSDYMERVCVTADTRKGAVENAIRAAFEGHIERRETEVVVFSGLSATELAKAIISRPVILKALLACCNVAARAIERDLGIKGIDTFDPRIDHDEAKVIAGYIRPFLPDYIEVPALCLIDRIAYIDKEIRKGKGNWEKGIVAALTKWSGKKFKKRQFEIDGESFELDAAFPERGGVAVGIDVKRIEARRDIHKRCDEIVNKASKLKRAYSEAQFGAVVYYPFTEEHVNIQSRLSSSSVDCVVFASESEQSIENAVKLLLSRLGVTDR